jgi:cob(I)alamin adenosyltransferase
MLLVYTGEGKGKTTAAVGQTLRALGQGLGVAFCQFMKRPGQAGEQTMLQQLLHDGFRAGGKGFLRPGDDPEPHRRTAGETLDWCLDRLVNRAPRVEMLVLDEALYALGAALLSRQDLERVMDKARDLGVHLVLTGRGLPPWLEERADLVTEMRAVKHPYAQGIPAARGIEF